MATAFLAYGGTRSYHEGKIRVVPLETLLRELPGILDRPHRALRLGHA